MTQNTNKKTKTRLIILATLFFASVLFLFPIESNARGLVPCGGAGESTCTLCHLVQGIHNIITWGRNIAVTVGIFFITVSGILYLVSAGNSGLIEKAKSGIKYSLIGFALLLSSWLIVNTVIKLMGSETSLGTVIGGNWWSLSVTCAPGVEVTGTTVAGGGTTTPGGGTVTPPGGGIVTPPGGGAVCTNPDTVKSLINSGGSICSSTSCPYSACIGGLTGKNIEGRTYEQIIKQNSWVGSDLQRYKVVAAIMCRESNAGHTKIISGVEHIKMSPDKGCGLMQITKSAISSQAQCDAAYPNTLAGITANINEGIEQIKDKYADAPGDSTYGGGVTKYQNTFAMYNCCANGEDPSDPSSQTPGQGCLRTDGWPSLPKWACPIAPGIGQFNMCDVKDYACSVSACI